MELVKGKRYWCVWAHRYATFEEVYNNRAWFSDITGASISCDLKTVNDWTREKK